MCAINFSSQEAILMALSKGPNRIGQVQVPEFAMGRSGGKKGPAGGTSGP